jgi:hypothetical protein
MALATMALLAAPASAAYDYTSSAYEADQVLRGGNVDFSMTDISPDGLAPADSGDILGLKAVDDYICLNCGQETYDSVAMARFTFETGLTAGKDELRVTANILTSYRAINVLLLWDNAANSWEAVDSATRKYGWRQLGFTTLDCTQYWDGDGTVQVAVIQYGWDWRMQLYVDYACIEVDVP